MKLVPGNFLGTSVRKRFVSGFIFTEYRYAPSTTLRLHSHELAYFSVVLRGAYEEQCSSRRIQQCDTETVLYHPADEMHRTVLVLRVVTYSALRFRLIA